MLTKEYILKSLKASRKRVPWDHERVPDHLFYETEYRSDKERVDVSSQLEQIEKQVKD